MGKQTHFHIHFFFKTHIQRLSSKLLIFHNLNIIFVHVIYAQSVTVN